MLSADVNVVGTYPSRYSALHHTVVTSREHLAQSRAPHINGLTFGLSSRLSFLFAHQNSRLPLSTSGAMIPTPAPPTPMGANISTISSLQHRFCLSTIRSLKKLKDAGAFLRPVDPVSLNIPHCPSIIKNPMDLGNIERRLMSSNPSKPDPNPNNPRYYSAEEFVSDVRLVFSNCITFNGPDHMIAQAGKHVESVFDKQIKQLPPPAEAKATVVKKVATPPLPPPAPPAPAKKASVAPVRRPSTSVQPVIRRNEAEQLSARPKREIHPPAPKDLPYADMPKKMHKAKVPKDDGTAEQLKYYAKILNAIKLDIPTYYKVIKKPMSTMQKKLDAGEYPNATKFFEDFKLMIRNCFVFNPSGTPVNQAGIDLQRLFDEKWKHLPPLQDASNEEDEESEEERNRWIATMEAQIKSMRSNLMALKNKPAKEKKKKEKKEKAPVASSSKGADLRQPCDQWEQAQDHEETCGRGRHSLFQTGEGLESGVQPYDFIFPAMSANGIVHSAGAGILGNFSTHCFHRGGAQYWFMFAPVGQRWTLAKVRWWGGWAEGWHRDTLVRYLLDELHAYETDYSDALAPISRGADASLAGEHALASPASTEELRSVAADVKGLCSDIGSVNNTLRSLTSVIVQAACTVATALQHLDSSQHFAAISDSEPCASRTPTPPHAALHNTVRPHATDTRPPSPGGQNSALTSPHRHTPSMRATSVTSQALPPGLVIPRVPVAHPNGTTSPKNRFWKDIVEHWLVGDPDRGLNTPLKDQMSGIGVPIDGSRQSISRGRPSRWSLSTSMIRMKRASSQLVRGPNSGTLNC
ncbi:Bromodomain-containing protein [Rhizopogon salebrosus TDB-379]|nr:Bromodomain-containing protein [Rhizopogon salebrosus TDB-379]